MAMKSGVIFVAGIKLIQSQAIGLISKVKRTSSQKFHCGFVSGLWLSLRFNCFLRNLHQGGWQKNSFPENEFAKQYKRLVLAPFHCLPVGFNNRLKWNFFQAHCLALPRFFSFTAFIGSTFPVFSVTPHPTVNPVKQVKVKARTNGFALAIEQKSVSHENQ